MKPTMQHIEGPRFVLANKRVEERRRATYREPAKVWNPSIRSRNWPVCGKIRATGPAPSSSTAKPSPMCATPAIPVPKSLSFNRISVISIYRLSEPEKAVTAYRDALELAERNSVADPDGLGW